MDFVTDHTVRFINAIHEVKSLENLSAFMKSVLSELNVHQFALLELGRGNRKGEGVLTTFPVEWGDRYVAGRYEYYDPVNIKIVRIKRPFAWDGDTLRQEGYLDGKSRKVFHEGGDFGLREGYTFPIFNTNGYAAVISYATDRMEDNPKLLPALQLIALYFHAKYRELSGLDRDRPVPNLTPRERECLRWAGAGKTDWEIGEVLSISEPTVHTHVESAKRKLGVNTRVQAIFEAARHYLISV